jgi:hypothetical protein
MKHEWKAEEKRVLFIGILCGKVKVKVKVNVKLTKATKAQRGVEV